MKPKVVTTFSPGDACFAKVRGFPAWPARVIALAEENAAKQFRYHVVFFGTGETGLMKGDEMFDYASNRDKFVRTVKRKGFQDGMAQIEAYLELRGEGGLSTTQEPTNIAAAPPTEADDTLEKIAEVEEEARETTDEESLVIDENRAEETKKKVAAVKKKALASRKKLVSDSEVAPSPKRPKSATEGALMSRSGRKIKPKKFSDEQDTVIEETPRPKKPAGTHSSLSHSDYYEYSELSAPNYTEEDAEGMPIQDCTSNVDTPGRVILAKLPSGQLARIKVDVMRPSSFPDDEARIRWDQAVARNSRKLKMQLQEGILSVEQYLHNTRRLIQSQALRTEETLDQKNGRLQWLRVECRMVDIDREMRTCLSLNAAKVEEALPKLDELAALDLDPLMLKKHPHVVETVKKLRRYIGNLELWQLSDEDKVAFEQSAQQIRLKAEFIYNKMKSLYVVPQHKSFWQVFTESVKVFMEKTKDMDLDLVYRITLDPTVNNNCIGAAADTDDKDDPSPTVETSRNNGVDSSSDEEAENRPPLN